MHDAKIKQQCVSSMVASSQMLMKAILYVGWA